MAKATEAFVITLYWYSHSMRSIDGVMGTKNVSQTELYSGWVVLKILSQSSRRPVLPRILKCAAPTYDHIFSWGHFGRSAVVAIMCLYKKLMY
jgi:hypothetical protein